jgi:CheY-like chemotaxis protein
VNIPFNPELAMKSIFSTSSHQPLHVLVVGNNPIEMGAVLEKLHQVKKRKVVTETAFDIRSTVERLTTFNPNFILIDDNLGNAELLETINTLAATKKTRHVPITILKNSNYREILPSAGILDYLLKQSLSTESLYSAIKNSVRLKKTQKLFTSFYQQKGGLFNRLGAKRLDLVS